VEDALGHLSGSVRSRLAAARGRIDQTPPQLVDEGLAIIGEALLIADAHVQE